MSDKLDQLADEFDAHASGFAERRRRRREELERRKRQMAMMDASLKEQESVVLGDVQRMRTGSTTVTATTTTATDVSLSSSGSYSARSSRVSTLTYSNTSIPIGMNATPRAPAATDTKIATSQGIRSSQPAVSSNSDRPSLAALSSRTESTRGSTTSLGSSGSRSSRHSEEELEIAKKRKEIAERASEARERVRVGSQEIEQAKVIADVDVLLSEHRHKRIEQARGSRIAAAMEADFPKMQGKGSLGRTHSASSDTSTGSASKRVTFAKSTVEESSHTHRVPPRTSADDGASDDDIEALMDGLDATEQERLAAMLGADDADDDDGGCVHEGARQSGFPSSAHHRLRSTPQKNTPSTHTSAGTNNTVFFSQEMLRSVSETPIGGDGEGEGDDARADADAEEDWRGELNAKKAERKKKSALRKQQLDDATVGIVDPAARRRARRALERSQRMASDQHAARLGAGMDDFASQVAHHEQNKDKEQAEAEERARQKVLDKQERAQKRASRELEHRESVKSDLGIEFGLNANELDSLAEAINDDPDALDTLFDEDDLSRSVDTSPSKKPASIARDQKKLPPQTAKKTTGTTGNSLAFMLNQNGLPPRSSVLRPSVSSAATKRTRKVYCIRGKGIPRVSLVHNQHFSELAETRCYVVDDVRRVYVWCGSASSRLERASAQAFAIAIKDNEYTGHIDLKLQATLSNLSGLLAGSEQDVQPVGAGDGDDGSDGSDARAAYEDSYFKNCHLYVIMEPPASKEGDDGEGAGEAPLPSFSCTEVANGKRMTRAHLNRHGAFLLVCPNEGFAWVGGRVPVSLREACADEAEKAFAAICHEKGWVFPPPQPVTSAVSAASFAVEKDQVESALFQSKFRFWEKGNDIGVAEMRNPVPLESKAFRARALTAAGNIASNTRPTVPEKNTNYKLRRARAHFYSFAELQAMVASGTLPEDVDPKAPEDALAAADFREYFTMSPADFSFLPRWKRENISRSVFAKADDEEDESE